MKKKSIIIAILIVLIDRISKLFIVNNFDLHESKEIINNFLYITHTENTGAAFSIFTDQVFFIVLVSIIMIGVLATMLYKETKFNKYKAITYGILIGGVIGNFIDRIYYGHVIDFIDTYIFNYNFPIFNVADMGIVIGTLLLLIEMIVKGEYNDN
jgi:signal peptidase II